MKSIESVSRKFHSGLRNLVTLGFVSASSILSDLRSLIKNAVADAYIAGLAEGGIPADEMTDDDALMIVELSSDQLAYVTDFARAIRDAKGDTAAQRDILDNRIDLWTQSIEAAGMQGLASAKANEMVTWKYGDTEHCDTCLKLNGQAHRRKWFANRNYFPRTPGAAMSCGGYNCQCTLE